MKVQTQHAQNFTETRAEISELSTITNLKQR